MADLLRYRGARSSVPSAERQLSPQRYEYRPNVVLIPIGLINYLGINLKYIHSNAKLFATINEFYYSSSFKDWLLPFKVPRRVVFGNVCLAILPFCHLRAMLI